jgi:hypothetical protein
MKYPFAHHFAALLVASGVACSPLVGQVEAPAAPAVNESAVLLGAAALQLMDLVNPPQDGVAQVLALELEVIPGEGVPEELAGRRLSMRLQAPDRLKVTTEFEGVELTLGRNGGEMWVDVPSKGFGVLGKPEVPRFQADPASLQPVKLDRLALPIQREQIGLLPAFVEFNAEEGSLEGRAVRVISAVPTPAAIEAKVLPSLALELTIPEGEMVPLRVGLTLGESTVRLKLVESHLVMPMPEAAYWEVPRREGGVVEEVALSHLTGFLSNFAETLQQRIPSLGPASGERTLVATEGNGRLEIHDGTRVLFLAGTPAEMGRQHGVLLREEVRDLMARILYGVGVGSSFAKGEWFFGEIESAQARLQPFMEGRHLQEMDALAEAVGLHPQEVRLANLFPELFHCSGFALHGTATVDGAMYHGRILDYLKGMGLEQNAVVMVMRPDVGNAWVNCGYAGFTGSVTAMNDKHIAIGEMGGRGEGNWDGKPMAQLVREAMEKASTIDEAVEIFRKGPRTCEYYYVISDGKSGRACGIKATPEIFEIIWSGESHPELPSAVADSVLLSAGDRYTELVRRVEAGHGKFTPESAMELMTRPVCMGSNIQSVLFAPTSLDFWVANADSKEVASHTRYTRYNLRELLDGPPAN